ncbi:3023_t:CDS:1, partial [Dentiscutata heterogama]
FIVRIVQKDQYGTRPGFLCKSDTQNQIYNTASTAINETYQKLFDNKTHY